MLQAIRSKATSLVVKILFVLLIVTFGLWGIGDIFRNRGADTTVVTVGGHKIDAQELNQEVRNDAERLRAMMRGATIDNEQLKQLGIVDGALQRLINRELIELEIRHLHLAVGDDAVRQTILSNRAFQNDSGAFDRNLYKQLLASRHMSEQQYEALLRRDIVSLQLNTALADGVVPPAILVDTLYRNRAERRVASVVTLPPSAIADPGTPNDADLTAFYEAHKEEFRTPELRSFEVGLLQLDDVAANIKVPESKLREEYDTRIAEFHMPEERRLQQLLFPDEAKAKEAEAQLAAGKDFAEVGRTLADATPDKMDLGFVKRDDLPPQIGDVAFSLKAGEASQPVQSSFGWHILRVADIKPDETQPFEAVKDKLNAEVARDMAGDQIAKLANQIDDALAGGSSFADVTQRFGLKVTKIDNVDARGHDVNGKQVELPQPTADILRTAFSTESGQASQLTDMPDSGYFIVQVDNVTLTAIKPLDDVRTQAIQLWQTEQRTTALERLAKEMTDEVNGGRSLSDVAAAHKLTVITSEPLARSGGDAKVPPAVVAKIFEAKPNGAVFAQGNDGFVVAQVKDVLPPDPTKESDATAQLSRQLAPSLQNDLLEQFDQALRARFPVSPVDQAVLARAF